MPTTKTFNNSSYNIPLEGELNWAALSDFLVDLADNAQTTNKQKVAVRVATASPVTVLAATDCVIVTDLAVAGAVAVNLPAGVSGQMFTVIDGKGDAGTNNITITPAAGTINGAATYVIDSNRAGVTLVYNGTEWTVTAEFISSGDIPRDQIQAGTADHVVINGATGDLSSEATLAQSRGGMAADASAFADGYVKKATGVFTTGAIAAADLPTLIDATKIADGSVTNAEFQHIGGLTSDAQTQIGTKVTGDASSTDNAVARFDLATGKVIQNSGVIIDDSNNVTGVNDLTVTGDLTVNGTTVTLNTATLDVEDVNITVNKGGTDGSSEGAGITVDRTGTKGSIIYANAATSKYKIGDLGSEVEVATISGAQVLTNKDIDGGTASNTSRVTIPKNTKANLDALTRKEGTLVYATDLARYYYDDGSTLKEIGSGASGRNYLSEHYTADALGTVGNGNVTDTGNRSTGTMSAWQSTNTTNISLTSTASALRQTNSYLFTGSGNAAAGTTFVESPGFVLDAMDLGKPVTVSVDVSGVTADGNFDVCMVRYDSSGTYVEKISIAGNASGATPASAKLPTGTVQFNGFFVASSTATDYYALRLRRLAGTDVPKIDSIKVSPENVVQGTMIADSVSVYNSGDQTLNNATLDPVLFDTELLDSASAFASNTYTCKTPGVYTLTFSGSMRNTTAGSATDGWIINFKKNGSALQTARPEINAATVTGQYDNFSHSVTTELSAGDAITVGLAKNAAGAPVSILRGATLNVVGRGNNTTMANRAVEEFAASTTGTWDADAAAGNTVYGVGGATISGALTTQRTKVVQFSSPILATDHLELQYLLNGTADQWVNAGSVLGSYQSQNTANYGARISDTSSTTVTVLFYRYMLPSATYGSGTGADWATATYSAWRVRKVSGGASVGFPVSTANIVGRTDGSTPGSGYIGEMQTITPSGAVSTVSGTANDGGSAGVTLSPGTYLLEMSFNCTVGTMSALTEILWGIGTASGTGTTGLLASLGMVASERPASHTPTGNFARTLTKVVNVTSTTTYYPKLRITATVGTATNINYIWATRIA